MSWSYLILYFLYFLQQSPAATHSKVACLNLQPKLEGVGSRETQNALVALLDGISPVEIWVAFKTADRVAVNMSDSEGLVSMLAKAIAASPVDEEDPEQKAQLIVYTYCRDAAVSAALAQVHE